MPSGGLVALSTLSQFLVPVWNGTGGAPTRAIHVTVLTTSSVAIEELRRVGNEWVHDGTLARDASVALSQTMTATGVLTAFAVANPVAESATVLFLVFNQASGAPDNLVINSVDMAGGTTLTAVAVTIAGANSIPAADLVAAVGCTTATNKAKFMSQDDWYSADITGTVAGFTFTFADAVVAAVDTSINVNTTLGRYYSMYFIGSTVLLLYGALEASAINVVPLSLWTITAAGAKIAEYRDVAVGGVTISSGSAMSRVFAMDGAFAIASPNSADSTYRIRKIPLASLTAN